VNRSNLQSIIQQLLAYLVKETPTTHDASQLLQNASSNIPTGLSPNQSPAYRLVLSQRMLTMGSQYTYENITNFEWYLSVLVDLAHISNVDIGAEIRDQLVDIAGRVRAARPYAVKLMSSLLIDDNLIRNANEAGSCSEVLWAAAWICSEYCEQVQSSVVCSFQTNLQIGFYPTLKNSYHNFYGMTLTDSPLISSARTYRRFSRFSEVGLLNLPSGGETTT